MQLVGSRKGRSRAGALLAAVGAALGLALWAIAAPAHAQDASVVQRLEQYGKMSRRQARKLVRQVDDVLERNAEREGEKYDRLRKAVNQAVFGDDAGPGETREVYFQRLEQVLDRMKQGLDPAMLEHLFPKRENSAVLCANDFGVTMGECDALVAAASQQATALPYSPPDDGSALRQTLREVHGINGRGARRIASDLRELMLGVPKNLTRDEKGRVVLKLIEACPGGLTEREAQIRAWHVGPTPGLARCIVGKLVENTGGSAAAIAKLQEWFGMRARDAQDVVRWAAPDAVDGGGGGGASQPEPSQPRPAEPEQQPRQRQGAQQQQAASAQGGAAANPQLADQWRKYAKGLYRQGRFREAAQAYLTAARANANDARIFAGLGASQLHAGNPQRSVRAYRRAVKLAPENPGYRVALGRALLTAGHRDAAVKSLKQALLYDPDYEAAKQGLRSLGAEPEPPRPELPETPSRNMIISVMRPLQSAIQGCAPNYSGTVTFELKIEGETGNLLETSLQGELADTDKGQCMLGIVRGASFPRFKKEKLEISYPYEL